MDALLRRQQQHVKLQVEWVLQPQQQMCSPAPAHGPYHDQQQLLVLLDG